VVQLAFRACVGLILAMVGIYGLLAAFIAVGRELAQPWAEFSSWCSDLAHGLVKLPPETFSGTLLNAEFTWLISSIVPLTLLGLGICLLSETFDLSCYGSGRRPTAALPRQQSRA